MSPRGRGSCHAFEHCYNVPRLKPELSLDEAKIGLDARVIRMLSNRGNGSRHPAAKSTMKPATDEQRPRKRSGHMTETFWAQATPSTLPSAVILSSPESVSGLNTSALAGNRLSLRAGPFNVNEVQ